MLIDRMIGPINVYSISEILFTKHDSRNTQLNMFKLNKIKFLTSHDRELTKTFPLMYRLLM